MQFVWSQIGCYKWNRVEMAESEQNQDADGDSEDEENSIATTDKIGILFVALGQETSGEVMKFLTEYEIEEITQAVAAL